MQILLLSDIHANFIALEAVSHFFRGSHFEAICNCGDSLVYAPYPNETLHWLQAHQVHSIIGNTDRKVRRLLRGKTFKKPKKADKRVMYTWTAAHLTSSACTYLLSLKKSRHLQLKGLDISLFHGSPEDPDEFLGPWTKAEHFAKLARSHPADIILTGHSHCPYHTRIGPTHFINPGSVGRMFDGNPAASCAVLTLKRGSIETQFYRIPWSIDRIVRELKRHRLPALYQAMYITGKKLN